MNKTDKIIVTGAAGLVGQNLVVLLVEEGYTNIVAMDKNPTRLKMLSKLNPSVSAVEADIAVPGPWQKEIEGAAMVLALHAEITGLRIEPFIRNNITATKLLLDEIKKHTIPFSVHIGSSVVHSKADDHYTNTKKEQEKLILDSGVPCSLLRPTLMFGWFDPKHFGWLSRFMERAPVFPIPGNGRYLRQPLYSRDFCRVIVSAMEQQQAGGVFDIVGTEEVDYIDIIRAIKKVKNLKTCIVKIPYHLFYCLLKFYALFSKTPPFTADQLAALTAGDYFKGVDIASVFGVTPTPFEQALTETFTDQRYSNLQLERDESNE
jgi:nucleoside-diphosphate-sugar epimerase